MKMKKALATLLCLVMTFSILSGCSKANTDSKPTEDTTTSSTEESTTEETTEPTAQPTESVTTEPVAEEDVIIPLYAAGVDASTMDPCEMYQTINFVSSYFIQGTDRTTSDGGSVYRFSEVEVFQLHALPRMTDDTGVYDIVFYLYDLNGYVSIYYESGDRQNYLPPCVPLWYNQTRGCLVAYSLEFEDGTLTPSGYTLQEFYYDPYGQMIEPVDANPADYGL